jgi:hypothetical protein
MPERNRIAGQNAGPGTARASKSNDITACLNASFRPEIARMRVAGMWVTPPVPGIALEGRFGANLESGAGRVLTSSPGRQGLKSAMATRLFSF